MSEKPDRSAIEREIEEALLVASVERDLPFASLEYHGEKWVEAAQRLGRSMEQASEAVRAFTEAWRRGEEIDFLELILHYDEVGPPGRPWKRNVHRYRR